MHRRVWLRALAYAILMVALAGVGWAVFFRADTDQCYACNRAVHAHSRTVATVDGHARTFCCPACALSMHRQSGKAVTITGLTSYADGKAIAPEKAYVVTGSDVNLCATKEEMVGADKQPEPRLYDRCAPSMIAFPERDEAVRFSREHGGDIKPFREIASSTAGSVR